MPEPSELSVTEQIVNSAPEECDGCLKVITMCSEFSVLVLEDQLTLGQAQNLLNLRISRHCRGLISVHESWGVVNPKCTFDIPLGQTNVTSNQ